MLHLKFASCMAENSEAFCQALADYVRDHLGITTEYVTGIPWQERERRFDAGEIQVLWLCGLPYIYKADVVQSDMELLAVPIPKGRRYLDRPVYFSDVVVRCDSPYQTFAYLRGAAWAYNESRSHSGFNVVRAYLAECGERHGYFGEAIESGAHTLSLGMILGGRVDGAAIDSTVLEWIVDERREMAEEIRVIETIGPSPIPPWVISQRLPQRIRSELRGLLMDMGQDPLGRSILACAQIARFVGAEDSDYDPIRRMARKAEPVLLA